MASTEVYATVAELVARLGTPLTGKDDLILALLTASSRQVDNFCNRAEDGFVAPAATVARIFTGTGKRWLDFGQYEAFSVTAVGMKLAVTDTTFTALVAADWRAFRGNPQRPNFNRTPFHGIQVTLAGDYGRFLDGRVSGLPGFPLLDGEENVSEVGEPTVEVTGRWGFNDTVPPEIREATIMIAARWFKRGEGAWSDALASADFGIMLFRKKVDPDVEAVLTLGRYVRKVVL